MEEKNVILDQIAMERALLRISHEIIERNKGVQDVVLIGIVTRGFPMAKIIKNNIDSIENSDVPVGKIGRPSGV